MHAIEQRCANRSGVAPWVAAIERLWDDPAFDARHCGLRHCGLAKAKVRPWDMERAGQQYTDFFESLR
jgi:hypothetical protein